MRPWFSDQGSNPFPCIGRWSLNHWTTREVPCIFLIYRSSISKILPLRYFILINVVVNGTVLLISLSNSSLLAYRNATDFCLLILYLETWFCILKRHRSFLMDSLIFLTAFLFLPHHRACRILVPWPEIEPVPAAVKVQSRNLWTSREFPLTVFWWRLFGFLYIISCHLKIETVLLIPFRFRCLLFLFLTYILWLGLPVLCWIKVMSVDIIVLFLILEEKLSAFHCCVWCLLWACHV